MCELSYLFAIVKWFCFEDEKYRETNCPSRKTDNQQMQVAITVRKRLNNHEPAKTDTYFQLLSTLFNSIRHSTTAFTIKDRDPAPGH